jgi:hypothetical protein
VDEKSACVAHSTLDALIVNNFTIVGYSEVGTTFVSNFVYELSARFSEGYADSGNCRSDLRPICRLF